MYVYVYCHFGLRLGYLGLVLSFRPPWAILNKETARTCFELHVEMAATYSLVLLLRATIAQSMEHQRRHYSCWYKQNDFSSAGERMSRVKED